MNEERPLTHCDAEKAIEDGTYQPVSLNESARGPESHSAWDEKRIREVVSNAVKENLTLEYKAAASLKREPKAIFDLTKDVSAMANSAGGVIIYGIGEVKATKQLQLDPVDWTAFTKEWIEQIASQISPRISGLKIHPVQIGVSPDHGVYVLEVPQGTTAHQATDRRYYRRHNFEAVPMYDHEIRDVMSRTKHPRISLSARLVLYPRPASNGANGALVITITNESDVFARYVSLVIDAPLRILGNAVLYGDAVIHDGPEGTGFRLNFSNHMSQPLFPQSTITTVFQHKPTAMLRKMKKELDHLKILAFADSMPKMSLTFRPEDITERHKEIA